MTEDVDWEPLSTEFERLQKVQLLIASLDDLSLLVMVSENLVVAPTMDRFHHFQ